MWLGGGGGGWEAEDRSRERIRRHCLHPGGKMDWNGWSWERGAEGGFWARSGIAHRMCETGKRGWGQLGSGGRGRGSLDVLVCRPCLLNIRVSLESGETRVETDPGSGTGGQDCKCGPGGVPGAGGGDGKKRLREGPSSV